MKISQIPFPCLSLFFFFLTVSAVLLFCSFTSTPSPCPDLQSHLSAKVDMSFQEFIQKQEKAGLSLVRRILSGPGSSPPRCAYKCGKCKPCRPVHVPVPPGTPVTAEYYPEAWRCKCGNKLYMP